MTDNKIPKGLGQNLDYQVMLDCVHCGLCLGACPTYLETGNENDSPRGRIYLWRSVTDGRLELDETVRHHLDLCLECRACETACPSGVQYGRIIGSYKKDRTRIDKPAPQLGKIQRWMLFKLTPSAKRMRRALAPMRLLQKLRLGGVVNLFSKLLPKSMREMQEIIPPRLQPHYGKLPELLPAEGKRRARVALLTGCASDAFFPQTTYATAKVLQKNGCDVWIPPTQDCCGALHYHGGLVEEAQKRASHNCEAFAKGLPGGAEPVDAIINNAGGCGPVLKEYHEILHGTESEEAGQAFASKVKDIHEFLIELGPISPEHPLPMKATYHDACGLCHAQQIRQQPRQLLSLIPELELRPLAESENCCGAAGSYNIEQPEMAQQVGERKARNIIETGAEAVFVANVGCLLQIDRHLRRLGGNIQVSHPIEALWAAYQGKNSL